MTFPVYHGITLAANGWIENLVVERLAADPSPVEAGRIWFNTTDKVFRQSTLNGVGAVVVRTYSTQEELNAAIAVEVTARTAADATLQGNIDAEATARAAADVTLQGNINTEATARAAADATLQANVDAEATARAAADATLQGNVDAEVTARTAADATLQANIDSEATARAAADVTLQGNINAEATARAAADTTLQGNIDAVNSRVDALGSAFNYVGTLEGGVDAGTALDMSTLPTGEKDPGDYFKVSVAGYFKATTGGTAFYANVNDGLVWNLGGSVDVIDNTNSAVSGTAGYITVTGSADTGFTVDVDTTFRTRVADLESGAATEVTARAAADATLQGNINAEATARAAADVTLQANIAAEATARAAADTTLQGNIDAEATARAAADTTLQNSIGTLASLTTSAQSNLVDAVNEINSLVAGGTADVRSDYNATIFKYDSKVDNGGTAATSYTIDHGLNFAFTDVSVFIERSAGSGLYFNDIVSVEQTTSNQIVISLTTALHVKVIVRSAVGI